MPLIDAPDRLAIIEHLPVLQVQHTPGVLKLGASKREGHQCDGAPSN